MFQTGFCGQQKMQVDRIVGGEEAVPHEFPWYEITYQSLIEAAFLFIEK